MTKLEKEEVARKLMPKVMRALASPEAVMDLVGTVYDLGFEAGAAESRQLVAALEKLVKESRE